MKKSHESKMLDKVRRWRRKAYEADKAKPLRDREQDTESLARKLDLPVAGTRQKSVRK